MKNENYYKIIFLVAGIWNLGTGLFCWIGSSFMPDVFFKMGGMPYPTSLFPFHAMFWFVIAFGIGFIIVSRDITKNHGIVLVGLVAEISFLIDCMITVSLGEASFTLLGAGLVDLIFAVFFMEFLFKIKKVSGQTK
jgi:hypothetical protein